MKGYFTMSEKEGKRVKILEKLIGKQIKEKRASLELGVTVRQVRRLKARYEQYGGAGLVHKGRGKTSNRKLKEEERMQIIGLVKSRYDDFGPTLALEKLQELHGLNICGRETLRKLMIEEGIWKAHKHKQGNIHQMRERRSCVGELVQVDGSPHAWFEERGDKCTLLVYIDDASGRLMHLEFAPAETTQAYFKATEIYLYRYGKPLAFYLDKHGVFRVNTTHKGTALVSDSSARTQFGTAMDILRIELIFADSPQAKGRVERMNLTLQDRLVKELRLRNICTIEDGNAYLPTFMAYYNAKFARIPQSTVDAHRPLVTEEVLSEIFVIRSKRKISRNLEVHYNNQIYQIMAHSPSYRLQGADVMVSENKDGIVKLFYKEKELLYKLFCVDKASTVVTSKLVNLTVDLLLKKERSQSSRKPAANHPWRQNGTFLLGSP